MAVLKTGPSKLACRLGSDIITLYVGEFPVEYHVHEAILCQLPFFSSALQGRFREASEKAINMPEDEPEAIAALIEWLSTGYYSYDANQLQQSTMELRGAPKEVSEGLLEGLFHLEVCVVASKYDCSDLLTQAKNQFYCVSQDGLTDIDRLRLWGAQDSSGLQGFTLLYLEGPSSMSIESARIWVNQLFREHLEELNSTMEKFPNLILNMLELCAQNIPVE